MHAHKVRDGFIDKAEPASGTAETPCGSHQLFRGIQSRVADAGVGKG